MRRVWHREFNGWWYATLREGGKRRQIKLIKAPNNAKARKLAEDKLVPLLNERLTKPVSSGEAWLTVRHVIDGFLAHSLATYEPETHKWYSNLLSDFNGLHGELGVMAIRKKHVTAFVGGKYTNPTSQNKAIGAIKRAFSYALEEEYISVNPIAHVRKPRPQVRDRILSPGERELIIRSIRDQAFLDYFLALLLTGCRPGEVAKVSNENVDLANGIWILAKHKTAKRTGKPRTIYLCPEALAITNRLCTANPMGCIFRNRYGKPWTRNAVRLRFRRLRAKHPELKDVVAYTLRSTFATDALEAGIPDAAVAELLGHTNTDTLHRYYSRLHHRVASLRKAAAIAGRRSQDSEIGDPVTATRHEDSQPNHSSSKSLN